MNSFFPFLLNLLGWYWLIKLYRFLVYNSITHHPYTILCVYRPKSRPLPSPSLFMSSVPPCTPISLWQSLLSVSVACLFCLFFVCLFCLFVFVFCLIHSPFFFKRQEREKERERNINVWLLIVHPLLGTRPSTQACALDWESNWQPFDYRQALNPLSHTSQGYIHLFHPALQHSFPWTAVSLFPVYMSLFYFAC